MKGLSENDVVKLAGVDMRLIHVIDNAFYAWKLSESLVPVVTEGVRSHDRQRLLVLTGKSKTMNSKHLIGKACDICLLKNGVATWNAVDYTRFARLVSRVANAENISIRWGGSWKYISGAFEQKNPFDASGFFDGPHYEV